MITINLKPFGGTEADADSLYSNPAYEGPFLFKNKHDEILSGELGWEQGRYNNYRFYVGGYGSNTYYYSEDITHIEDRS